MPFSELHRMGKGKLESTPTKMANTSADPTFGTDNEFAELVWENGQIMVQGQTSRTRKSNTGNSFQTHTPKVQEKDRDVGMSKTGRFGTIDSVLNDFSSSEPSGPIGLGQDDEMVPWLNYPFDDNLPHDYSEFMNEFNGDNLNSISVHNHPVPNGKDTSYGQIDRNSDMVPLHGGARSEQRNVPKVVGEGPEPFRLGSGWFGSSMLNQNRSSIPSQRSTISDFTRSNTNNTQQTLCENSSVTPASITDLPDIMLEKQDPGARRSTGQFNNNMGLTNFSHFSRPATLSKSNLQSMKVSASPDKLRNSEKPTAEVISNPVESTVIESTSGSRSVVGFNGQSVLMPGKMDVRPSHGKPPKEPISTEHSEAICSENVFRNTRSTDQSLGQTSSFAASATIGRQESERDLEPVVGSSSMCSGSSAGGTSNEPKETLKRKSREADESEYQSEDAEEESVGVRKPANARGGTGARRSRAAEVHNLSERRRRDRINEKMRALQELIPNCNKVDKASMLDEAIEYLKTLQLQVQIMSMGAGMYMPPIMLPTGMHGPHFSPMGVGMGMGMGMGFGMGMFDMGGGRPMMMSPMHGMQFPRSPISGSTSLPMMGGSNVQMLGVPGQGLPMSMPHAPYVPLPEGFSARPVSLPDISGPTALLEDPNPVMPSSSKGLTQNKNSQMMTKTNGECSQNQPNMQATKEGLEQSAAVHRNDPALNDSCDGDINSAGGNENFN